MAQSGYQQAKGDDRIKGVIVTINVELKQRRRDQPAAQTPEAPGWLG